MRRMKYDKQVIKEAKERISGMTNKPTISLQQINERLQTAIDFNPLEQGELLNSLAKESGKKETQLRKQLEIFIKKDIEDKKKTIKQAGKDLTQKQFEILEKFANPENEMLQNSIAEGIEFINQNDFVRAHCKVFLNQILSRNYENRTIKHKYLELISGKERDWSSATELLRDYILSKLKIYTTKEDKNNEVWIYKEGIYLPEGKSEIKLFLREILEEQYSQYIFNKTLEKIEPDTFIQPKDFFTINYVNQIPVQNGILNVETMELEPYDPTKVFFSKLNAKFDLEATCPKINQFLKDVLSQEEDIKVFYEMVGFGLLKEYRYEKAFMLVGDGRNGKGKSIELIKRLVGIENCCSVPLSCLIPESFFISELFGKLFNLAGDIGNQDLKDTSMFKSLTGRDLVNAHRKFHNDISFQNYSKFIFACNEPPMVYDLSRGFWDRWILLEYPYTFVNQEEYNSAEDKTNLKIKDPTIIDKIISDEEMSGFLNECLAGLHRLKNNKKFSSAKGSEEVKLTWIRKSNSFIAFCFDMVESDGEGRITKKSLRKKYSDFCKEHKVPPKSDYVIKRVLQDTFGAQEDRGNELGNQWERVWVGVKWK